MSSLRINHPMRLSGSGKVIKALPYLSLLFLIACSNQDLSVLSRGGQISGTASMFSTGTLSSQTGSLAVACDSGKISLHPFTNTGAIDTTELLSSTIASDGSFFLAGAKQSGVVLDTANIKYILKAEGCGSEYYRPLTEYTNQTISGGSTLIAMSANVTDVSKRSLTDVSRESVKAAMAAIDAVRATTLTSLLDQVIGNTALTQSFQSITNLPPIKLKDLPPTTVSVTAQSTGNEGLTSVFSATFTHWNNDYVPAYEWSLDGVVVSTSATWNDQVGKDAQGAHVVQLRIGADNGSGLIDSLKPARAKSKSLLVSNDYPAVTPTMALIGSLKRNVLSGSVSIATGVANVNCETFSTLALTENAALAPLLPSDFAITCTQAGTQTVPFLLSTGDGTKTLALWARDSAGNVSNIPSTVSVVLDQTLPSLTLGSIGPVKGGAAASVSFTASDATSGIQSVLLEYAQDGSTFSTLADVTNQASPYSWTVPSVDVATAKVRITATDQAGNSSQVTSSAFIIDSTAPTVVITGPAINTPTQTSITVTGTCEAGISVTVSGTGQSGSQTTTCTAGSFSQSVSLSGSDGIKNIIVSQTDAAGNIGSDNRNFVKDTTAPTLSFSSPAANAPARVSLPISGVCESGLTVSISGTGVDTPSTTSCTSSAFSSTINFSNTDGTKNVVISQTDAAGNTATTSRDFTRVTSTPAMTLTGPAAGTNAKTGVTLLGTCDSAYTVDVSGADTSSAGSYPCTSGTFSIPVTFSGGDGSKSITVSQTDNLSNVTTITRAFIKDTVSPVIAISSPAANTSAQTGVTITGTCETGLTVNFSGTGLANVISDPCASGTFSQNAVFTVNDGVKNIIVSQTDAAGNIGSVNRDFALDTTVPALAITSPVASSVFQSTVNISGTCETGASTITISGIGVASSSSATCIAGAFTASLTLSSGDGTKAITFAQSDAAGNIGTVSRSFIRDTVAPVLTLSSPNGGQSFRGGDTTSVTWSTLESNPTTTPVSLSYSSDNGTTWVSIVSGIADLGGYTWTIPSINSTQVFVKVSVTDAAGNVGSVTSATSFTIDSTPPTTPVVTLSSSSYSNSQTVTLAVTCTADYAGILISQAAAVPAASSASWQLCAASMNFSVTAGDGAKTVYIFSKDAVGNVQSTSASVSMTLDQTVPVITWTTLPTAQVGGSSFVLHFSVTELNITTSQSFAISYSSDNGATWTSSGSVTSTAGPLSATNFNYTMTFPSVDTNQFKVKVVGSDRAGNSTTTISNAFIVDSTAPVLNTFQLAGGAVSVTTPVVTASYTATDAVGVAKMKFSEDATGAADSWVTATSNMTFTLSQGGQTQKTVYAWAMDAAGNISNRLSATISLDYGSPPTVALTSPVPTAGQNLSGTISLAWSCSSSNGLAAQPVSLQYSANSDGTGLQNIASNLTNNLTATTGSYSWSIPGGVTQFRILVKCSSAGGVVSQVLSGAFNTTTWSIWAGDIGLPTEGVNAYNALLSPNTALRYPFVIDKYNNIFIYYNNQLRKIDSTTGSVDIWAGNTNTCSAMTDGTTLSTSTVLSVNQVLGLSSDGLSMYAILCNVATVFKINLATKLVTKVVDIPALPFTAPPANGIYVTANRIFIFIANYVLYKVSLEDPSPVVTEIYGNASTAVCNNTYSIGTATLALAIPEIKAGGASSCAGGTEASIFANADASRIFIGIRTNSLNVGYVIENISGTYQINSAKDTVNTIWVNCVTYQASANKVLCSGRSSNTIYKVFDVSDMSSTNYTPTGWDSNLTTFTLAASNKNYFMSSVSGLWAEAGNSSTHLYGINSKNIGIGQPNPGNLHLVSPNGITYDSTNNSIYIQTANDLKIIDTNLTANIVRANAFSPNDNPVRVDKTGSRVVYYRSAGGAGIGQISPISTGASGVQIFNQTGTVTGPWSDGTPVSAATTLKTTMVSYKRFILPHSDGTTLFQDFSTNNYALYKISAGALYKVAGVLATTPAHRSGDNTGVANSALLAGIQSIQEIPTGSYAGDLLIIDGTWLRRISYKSEGTPKMYDIVDLSTAGFSATNLTDSYYDFDSEISSVLGSGKIYYYNGSVKRLQFDSTLANPVTYTYPFEGTSFTGNVQLEVTPLGLLVLQPAKARVLKTSL